jgi:choline dehydrogenase
MLAWEVIGGGTAGITIASRLAEDSSISVAIIEAGGFYEVDNGNYSVLPAQYPYIPFLAPTESFPQQPLMDWGLVSLPQTGALNRRIHYAQGKTLSGSSALNAMAYHRGTSGCYQRWADLTHDDSYTFESLLPYFEKSCHFTPPDDAKRKTPNATVRYDPSVFSDTGGPLQVSYSNWVDPALTWFQRAFEYIGLPISDVGSNSGSLTGKTAWLTSTINPNTGERSSSQTSFLEQAIEDTNIMVYKQAQATKILFDSNVANGISVSTQGVNYTISASKEVILSAGAFHSPQLLMLSGTFMFHQRISINTKLKTSYQVSDLVPH